MARLPRVVGLVLCENLGLGFGPGQVTLERLFNARAFASFPTPPCPFVVYCALYGEKQEGKMELVVTRLETEEVVYRYSRWQHLPGGGLTAHITIFPKRCAFPVPGRYAVGLVFEGQELSNRYLDVRRR
jgi:hypothetical protein